MKEIFTDLLCKRKINHQFIQDKWKNVLVMPECFSHDEELEKGSEGENSDDWPNS